MKEQIVQITCPDSQEAIYGLSNRGNLYVTTFDKDGWFLYESALNEEEDKTSINLHWFILKVIRRTITYLLEDNKLDVNEDFNRSDIEAEYCERMKKIYLE